MSTDWTTRRASRLNPLLTPLLTPFHPWSPMASLAAMISRTAAWHGPQPAVVDGARTLSFAEVEARSNRLAQALIGLSPQRGTRVAMLLPNRLEAVEIDFAIIKAAKVKVACNLRLRQPERAHILADSGADTLIYAGGEEAAVAELASQLPELRHLVRVGPGRLGAGYEDVMRAGTPRPPALAAEPDDPSLILYTSGTTGRAKGAVTTNRSRLASTLHMLANEIDPQPGDAMVHVGSMSHGSGSKVLAHFVRGSRNLPMARWDPEAFLRVVAEHRATHTLLVPTMVDALAEAASRPRAGPAWGPLKAITYGGAPMPANRLAAALDTLGPRLVQVYGSCEAPHPVLVLTPADHRAGGAALASAGREVVGVETRLVDRSSRPCPDGMPGELLVRGANVMAGYWRQPAATAEVLSAGWYRTGDIARRDENGYLHIVDRARDLIISGGYNVYPAELEAVLARHPGVAEVAVVGVPDDRWGEAVRAVVVRRPDAPPVSAAELIEFCDGQLAGYKKPRAVDFVGALPHGSTGKILRREVRDRYWTGAGRRV